MTTLADMTMDDLRQLIAEAVAEAVDDRLARLLGTMEMDEAELFTDEPTDTRTWDEVKQDIERHRWTPPPGTPSVTDLLREDRDS